MTSNVIPLRGTQAQRAAMIQHILDAVREGRNEVLPNVVDPPVTGAVGPTVAALVGDLDHEQRAALFNLLHHILNRDNLAEIHHLGEQFVRRVAGQYAELYVASRS